MTCADIATGIQPSTSQLRRLLLPWGYCSLFSRIVSTAYNIDDLSDPVDVFWSYAIQNIDTYLIWVGSSNKVYSKFISQRIRGNSHTKVCDQIMVWMSSSSNLRARLRGIVVFHVWMPKHIIMLITRLIIRASVSNLEHPKRPGQPI